MRKKPEHVVGTFEEAGARNVDRWLIEPIELLKFTLMKNLPKIVRAWLLDLWNFCNMKDNIKVHGKYKST